MPGFCTPDQVKQIIAKFLQDTGRGGHITGVVTSVSPLKVRINNKIEITEQSIYITDAAIGLKVTVPGSGTATLRQALQVNDAVLLGTQPRADGKQMYILLDRIQKYQPNREVSV
jgi:hypothetical protein